MENKPAHIKLNLTSSDFIYFHLFLKALFCNYFVKSLKMAWFVILFLNQVLIPDGFTI